MENFLSLKLEQILMDSIAKINFKTPTPIQAEAIPVALEGRDILGTAQTGTGKTAAFSSNKAPKIQAFTCFSANTNKRIGCASTRQCKRIQ